MKKAAKPSPIKARKTVKKLIKPVKPVKRYDDFDLGPDRGRFDGPWN